MSKVVVIDGVEYKSRVAAGKALMANGMSLGAAAEKVGCTYQTMYANTKGLEKTGKRRAKYRVLALGKTGKRTSGEIAKKTGLSVSAVVAMLKKNGIAIVTKEAKAAAKKAAKPAKAPKAPKAPKVDEVPLTPAQVTAEENLADDIPMDAAAEMAAMADMAA